jgi:ribosomal protein S18 acetylase RimI-like enzyme
VRFGRESVALILDGVSDIEIRPARHQDIPRLLEIRHAAFSEHAPKAYSETEVETLLNDVDESELAQMINDGQLFIARKDAQVVGLAGWKGIHLRHVYVDPTQTRQGIASQLLRHVEADFKERTGADHIEAGVGFQAEGFYLANGYQIVERLKDWDDSEYWKMTKAL